MSDENSLIGNENNHVVMDNRLIESKQMMPLNAAKIVRMAIAKITYEDEKFRTYSCSITELAEFLRVSKVIFTATSGESVMFWSGAACLSEQMTQHVRGNGCSGLTTRDMTAEVWFQCVYPRMLNRILSV